MKYLKLFEKFDNSKIFNKVVNEITQDEYFDFIDNHIGLNPKDDLEKIKSIIKPFLMKNSEFLSEIKILEFRGLEDNPIYIPGAFPYKKGGQYDPQLGIPDIGIISIWKYSDNWYILTRYITPSILSYYLIDDMDGIRQFFEEIFNDSLENLPSQPSKRNKINESHKEFTQFSQLIGKIVNRVYIDESKSKICFVTNDNEYHCYYAVEDCCNSVWFNHFNGIDFIMFQMVNDVISKNWKDVEDFVMSQECEEACIWTIITSKGYVDIELRNSHNGYYGGSISYSLELKNTIENMEIIYDDF